MQRASRLLSEQLPTGWAVRVQLSLSVPPRSEPEPDVAVVTDEDHSEHHPRTALLVVEAGHTSLRTDLKVKPRIYARAQVPEYWVIDIPARVAHVHRGPTEAGYDVVHRHAEADGVLRSATAPGSELDLAGVLPRG